MPVDSKRTVQEPASEKPDAPSTGTGPSDVKPFGFGRLARRITAWSGNFLATCVILILGFTFGRQVLQWWHNAPEPQSVSPKASPGALQPLTDPTLPHLLEFGDLPIQVTRVVFEGDETAALVQLRRRCRKVASRSDLPQRRALHASTQLLHRLDKLHPVEQGSGWKIYQTGGPVLMVLAVRIVAVDKGAKVGNVSNESVVSWGLGLRHIASTEGTEPAAPNRWTLLTGAADSPITDSGSGLVAPIPPGSHRTLAVQVAGGGALVGFRGQTDVKDWKQFFDRQGWPHREPWRRMDGSWSACYQQSNSGTCDVLLTAGTNGLVRGILTITPETRRSER